ncbi:hypothetical protein CBM2623_A20124 [Cupriavidus taiwanensis]|nr:hypothetical protein CBM2608_A20123 [Cupriavidus taiwanensis]SPA27028.1 hypothetical protein CBM2623_A20124 [Cupriavidus taiwanensis]SPA45262.1 hypothetical protein CBM2629_A20156 [Cupriavidus taiwanensis]
MDRALPRLAGLEASLRPDAGASVTQGRRLSPAAAARRQAAHNPIWQRETPRCPRSKPN